MGDPSLHPPIGDEVVVDDNAAAQILGDRPAPFAGAVEGEGLARSGVQPLQPAGDAKAGLVDMAHLRLADALADASINALEIARLPAHPCRDTGRAQHRRAEQIDQRLRRAILGDQLLDVEIDRRRPEPRAILDRRGHRFGKPGPGHPATPRAAVNRRLMFAHPQRALDEVEHLPLLHPCGHRRIERRAAMAARPSLMPHDGIGVGDLPERIALVAPLAAARLARGIAQAARHARLLLQPVARRRLRTGRTVLAQLPAQVRHLSAKQDDLAPQRRDQLLDFGRKNHPSFDSHSQPRRPAALPSNRRFPTNRCPKDSPGLELRAIATSTIAAAVK